MSSASTIMSTTTAVFCQCCNRGEFREFQRKGIKVLLEIILGNIKKDRLKVNRLVKGD